MMKSMLSRRLTAALFGTAMAAVAVPASATVFTGDLFYTLNNGGNNINKVAYSYDDATHSFSLNPAVNVGATNGADGIIFAPNGDLLIGGQGSGNDRAVEVRFRLPRGAYATVLLRA